MQQQEVPKYEIDIFWSDEDDAYIAVVPELPYCSAWGETYEEALAQAEVAIRGHLRVRRETGRSIPEPRTRPASRVNEAAEKFAAALRDSYKTVAERPVSAQQLNAELTQTFFNNVISNLRAQAESNRGETAGELLEQQRRQEATQALTQEAVNAYMDFLNSIFSYYEGNLDCAQRSTRE